MVYDGDVASLDDTVRLGILKQRYLGQVNLKVEAQNITTL